MDSKPRTTLPLDILIYIIDLLAGNYCIKSLQTLSLACKSMVPLCRKRLFSKLLLGRDKSYSERFSDLLLKTPDIASYVRSLDYSIYNPISDHELNILDMLKKHSSLQSVTLFSTQLYWNNFPESMRLSLIFLIQLPTVAQLAIYCIKRFPVTALSGCSNLINLQLTDVELSPPEVNQVISSSKIPTPISLYFDGRTYPDLNFAHLLDGLIVDFSRLQKAEFVVKSRRVICQLNELIKETRWLEYFAIRIYIIGE